MISFFGDEEQLIQELRDAMGPLSGRSLKFCSDACLRRYLEARNWNVEKAHKMLEDTIKWRSEYKPEEIRWVSFTLILILISLSPHKYVCMYIYVCEL